MEIAVFDGQRFDPRDPDTLKAVARNLRAYAARIGSDLQTVAKAAEVCVVRFWGYELGFGLLKPEYLELVADETGMTGRQLLAGREPITRKRKKAIATKPLLYAGKDLKSKAVRKRVAERVIARIPAHETQAAFIKRVHPEKNLGWFHNLRYGTASFNLEDLQLLANGLKMSPEDLL